MTTPRVTAVLVNYNAGAELRRALQSIAVEMGEQPWEAFVVDNASIDGSGAIAGEFAPHARLIANRENVGFARGVNQGLHASSSSRVLIINPDCRLVPGAMAAMMAALEAYPSCAIVGPRILDPDGSVQGSARGDPNMFTGLFGRTTLLRRLLPWLSVSKRNVVSADEAGDGGDSVVVDWLSGACMLARKDALDKVNGFDERYFLYWEDADLCRRLRDVGHHVRYVPGATAIHLVAHSSQRARTVAIKAFHESAYLYYATHVAPRGFKRILARGLLKARCYMRLRSAA